MTKNSELYGWKMDSTPVPSFKKEKKKDKYVQAVKKKFEQRSQTGIKKYNTTLERDDLSIVEWLTHAQEEAMDLTLYLERIKDELSKHIQSNHPES